MASQRGEKISRDLLVSLRRERGWTQARLAAASEIPLDTIKRWESKGIDFPSLDFASLERIAHAYGIEYIEFLARVRAAPPSAKEADVMMKIGEEFKGELTADEIRDALASAVRHKLAAKQRLKPRGRKKG